MKKLKGCTQTQCTEKKKKFKKDSERFCPSCGERLSFVCKQSKCFEEIDAACRGAYCPEHQAEHDEKAKKQREALFKLSAVAICAGLCAKIITDGIKGASK